MDSGKKSKITLKKDDIVLLRFFSQCLDRPAFQTRFVREGSIETFDRAIEDTITALNTGTLISREGVVLGRERGKSFAEDIQLRSALDTIVDLLRAVRSRYDLAVRRGEIDIWGEGANRMFCVHEPEVANWIDRTRDDAIGLFNEQLARAKLPLLRTPSEIPPYM